MPILKAMQYFPQCVLPYRYEIADALPLVCDAESVMQILPCFEAEDACELKEGEFLCSAKQGEVYHVDVGGSEVEWYERETVLEVLAVHAEKEESMIEEALKCYREMNEQWSGRVAVT